MRVRRWLRRIGIACLSLMVLAAVAYGALFIPTIYFRVALFMIERNSMMRDRVDWPTVRAEADQLLRDARHTRDTYPAIRLVLSHSAQRLLLRSRTSNMMASPAIKALMRTVIPI